MRDLLPNQETIARWQSQVDLLAHIAHVPMALVTRVHRQMIEAFVTSQVGSCPWRPGDWAPDEPDLYCYYVTHFGKELCVEDARQDPLWRQGLGAELGLYSYYGLPIRLPDQSVWGTICVMDSLAHAYTPEVKGLVVLLRDAMEKDLELSLNYEVLAAQKHELEASYLKLKDMHEALVEREKHAALGEIVAGVAHEIKNPLHFLLSNTQFLIEDLNLLNAKPSIALAEGILMHGQRIDAIVRHMLAHASRVPMPCTTTCDMNRMLRDSFDLAYLGMRSKLEAMDLIVNEEYDTTLGRVRLAADDLRRVFFNIISNALYELDRCYRSQQGDRRPTLWLQTRQLNGQAWIRIKDNGGGVPEGIRNKIFLPFFTTKPAKSGAGLGLSICKKIVSEDFAGDIALQSQVGEYAEFIVTVPIYGSSGSSDA